MVEFDRVVAEIASALDRAGIGYMIIGGIAVSVWGGGRSTNDVDIAVAVDRRETGPLLKALKKQIKNMPTQAADFAAETGILPFEHRLGVSIDLGLSVNPYVMNAIDRAVPFEFHGVPVKFCSVEDLILHKLVADRDRDRIDIAEMIERRGREIDRDFLDRMVHDGGGSRSIRHRTALPLAS